MKQTIYKLNNEDYHRGEPYKDYLSSTQLKHYLTSPKYAKYVFDNPDVCTISADASEKGSLYHSAMEALVNGDTLEQWRNSLLIFEPPINSKTGLFYGRDTKMYQSAIAEAQASNPDKMLTNSADIALIESMVNELMNNCGETSKQVHSIIKWGKAEVSHFVEYEGCKFKYRPDVETPKKIIDWKTLAVNDLHESTINRVIEKFGYGISAAFYQFFEHQRTGKWKDFFWIMQQKTAPYDAVFVSAEQWAFHEEDGIVHMGAGAYLFTELLRQHIYCTNNNNYDGAEVFIQAGFKGRRIMMPEPPVYVANRLINYFN